MQPTAHGTRLSSCRQGNLKEPLPRIALWGRSKPNGFVLAATHMFTLPVPLTHHPEKNNNPFVTFISDLIKYF